MSRYRFPESCQIPNLSRIYEDNIGYKSDGYFVEVGAYDGLTYSNTWGLAEAGWGGLYIEPVREYYLKCIENHQGHIGVMSVNLAAGEAEGQTSIYVNGGYSTAVWDIADSKKATDNVIVVPVRTLDSILKAHEVKPMFDVLVIDVEGMELEVLTGFTINQWKPKLAIVEAHEIDPKPAHGKNAAFINFYFQQARYMKIYSDTINNIYRRMI